MFNKLLCRLVNKYNKTDVEVKNTIDKKDIELYKEIYSYANNKLEQLHERKRHMEIKSLYVLQATAVVIALFTALLSYCNNLQRKFYLISKFGIFGFYIMVAAAIFFLLSSLNDGIVTWKLTGRLIKNKDIGFDWKKKIEELYGQDHINDNDINNADTKILKKNIKKGYYLESPHPMQAINYAKKGMSIEQYFKNMVEALSKSIDSAHLINIAKNTYFNKGIKLFVIAIFLVIFLGILVA